MENLNNIKIVPRGVTYDFAARFKSYSAEKLVTFWWRSIDNLENIKVLFVSSIVFIMFSHESWIEYIIKYGILVP